MGDTTTQGSTTEETEFNIEAMVLSDEKLFEIPLTYVDTDDQKKTSKFVFRLPNVQDMIRIGVIESQLLSDSKKFDDVTPYILNIAYFVATIKVCLVESPSWFDIDKNDDIDLLEVLYVRYSSAVEKFRSKRKIVLA